MSNVVRRFTPQRPTNTARVDVSTVSGTGLAVVLVWVMSLRGIEMPNEVAVTLGGLLVGFIGAILPSD